MEKLYRKIALAAVVCSLFQGCATIMDAVLPREPRQVDSAVVATWWDGPRIRPGVALVLQIGTAPQPPVNINTLVDQSGNITIPLLLQEPVACDGLTLEALRAKLTKEYSKYYRQPQISVTFAPFDASRGSGVVSPWGTVTVMGEVANPGPVNIPSTMELPVTKALQLAGGVKPFADKTHVRVSRCDRDGRQTRTIVDLNEIGQDGRVDKDMILRAGDVVWVPETWY